MNTAFACLVVHSNLWLECEGQVVLSRWRVRLLEAIDATGSIRGAAGMLKITYTLAWHRLDEMEAAFGQSLVERQRGGEKGGGAHLTPFGHECVARFQRFAAHTDLAVQRLYEEAFKDED